MITVPYKTIINLNYETAKIGVKTYNAKTIMHFYV
jgi:hypothetical protein